MTEKDSRPLIVHVIYHLFIGGLENGLVNIINRTTDGAFRHAILCLKDYSPEFAARITAPNVPILSMDKRPGNDLRLYYRLYQTFKTLQPTVVHSRNFSGLDSQLPAMLAGVPCRVHGEHGWDTTDLGGVRRKRQWIRRAHRPLEDKYIPLSQELDNYLTEKVGVPERRIKRICNGVDVERFQPRARSAALRLEGRCSQDMIVIGAVGRLQPVKNQISLVRAFATLLQRLPELPERLFLTLIGDGPCRTEIEQCIETEGIGDRVWLAGARDNVPELLQELDIFVLPSLAEGISNTLLEALACGVPVIATAVGGNPELVEHGETGLMVASEKPEELLQALERMVVDEDFRRGLATRARESAVAKFSLDAMVGNYMETYQALVREKAPERLPHRES